MNNYIINPYIIILSFDDSNNKNYILSKSESNIEPINFIIDDNNKLNCLNTAISTLKEYVGISILDIDIHLIDLHSKEIEKALEDTNNTNTIYPLYGVIIPYTNKLSNCVWKEYSFLESNPFSYSITRVSQNIIIQ